ncbi:multidrug resistance protein, MATE family [Mariniphaga anaerophila]|uniref:Multidrug resistance protein, MATE family n=1 Tax=Mariniphaga anaerophila TaxID=1484053 RepID=A0A1M4VJ08_9BACT|nr:MATE family efflux transporter [Mariniphaga anaerophila]SHE68822.1 multidrug resistance protein, MATE family [Mariniphaga anaerophila]
MNRDILRLAVPNIVSNITVPLLGLIDLALMGHMGSEIYIGAIAIGGVIFNFIYWGFGFLRMSTSGFAAQAFGEKNKTETINILARALAVAMFTGLVILALQLPVAWASFKLIGGSEEVELLAREYFLIRVWAAPAALSLFVFSGWFLGMQNARYPMIIAISANVANILLSVLFVFGLNMKSEGVALGTALSQYIGLLIAIFLFLKKYKSLLPRLELKTVFGIKQFSSFFKVNTDIFIRSFCIILVFTFFTSKSASTNDTILAVNSLLIQMLLFFSFFIDGFAFAGEALVGKFFGARQRDKLIKVVKLLFVWGLGLALAFTVVYFAGINFILRLLTSQEDVIQSAQPFIIWVIFIPLASFSSFIWDGIYIGATASAAMRNTLIAATLLVFAPVYFLLNPVWENHALWLAMVLFMFARGAFQTLLFKKAILK